LVTDEGGSHLSSSVPAPLTTRSSVARPERASRVDAADLLTAHFEAAG
jgi:hypothetical protein